MDCQNTVKGPVVVSGIALHTGARANLRILYLQMSLNIGIRCLLTACVLE